MVSCQLCLLFVLRVLNAAKTAVAFPGSGALRDMAGGRGAECAKTAFRFRHFKVKNQPRQSEIDRADLFKSSNSLSTQIQHFAKCLSVEPSSTPKIPGPG